MSEMTDYTMKELENMTCQDIDILMKREKDKAYLLLREAAEHFYEISRLYNVQEMPLTEKSYKENRMALITYASQLS